MKEKLDIALGALKEIMRVGTRPQGNTQECVIAYSALRLIEIIESETGPEPVEKDEK